VITSRAAPGACELDQAGLAVSRIPMRAFAADASVFPNEKMSLSALPSEYGAPNDRTSGTREAAQR
jgi:hypothetical protein